MSQLGALDRLAYRSQHLSFLLQATALQEVARIATRQPRPKLSRETIRTLADRRAALHARDLANVEAGLYPRSLLFDIPVRQFARAFPQLVRDVPSVLRRKRRNDFRDIPAVAKDRYPAYYRRTFHWQTDGYLSAHSAELYELGVELLFRGTADVMRRQVLPPITRLVQAAGRAEKLRVLDVACGTGPTLRALAHAHPALRLWGIDLSPDYVRAARKRLAGAAEVTLAVENAESLPFADGAFDAVTSVYLFHELPRNARRRVVAELFRVVKPGGVVVIEDSAQLSDSEALVTALRSFPQEFHEPFYDDYLGDDLSQILREAGFTVESAESHLVAKVVVGRRM